MLRLSRENSTPPKKSPRKGGEFDVPEIQDAHIGRLYKYWNSWNLDSIF